MDYNFDNVEFVIIRYRTDNLHVKMMQTTEHRFIASVYYITQDKPEKIASFKKKMEEGQLMAQVPGYSIFILPDGCLDGEKIPFKERKAIIEKMAKNYYYTWIIRNRQKYEAHKELEIV